MDDLPLSYRGIDFVSMTLNCRVYIVHFNSRKLGKVERLTSSILCGIEDESRPLVYEIDIIPLTRIKPWVSFFVICNLRDQFRAFSDQLYRTPMCHKSVRSDVVNQVPDIFFTFDLSCDSSVLMNLLCGLVFVLQLRFHPDFYEAYVPMKYSDYVKKMSKYASDSRVYHLSHF